MNSALFVCCKTLATEVDIHDFGVCVSPSNWLHNSVHDSTTDDFVVLKKIQLSSQDAIQVRGRREPKQAPLYHARDVNS